jgi:putative toxin-antitoxin system antitoxin component (TIGR02293 family)
MALPSHFQLLIGRPVQSNAELASVAESGIPTGSISVLQECGLAQGEIAKIIPPRTLKHRRSRRESLSIAETDRVLRVGRILDLAQEIFGSSEKALLWLRGPDGRYGQRAPLDLLSTETGGRLVENMLWQINEGIFA